MASSNRPDPAHDIEATEKAVRLPVPAFTHTEAYRLGELVRSVALKEYPNATIFVCVTAAAAPGTTPLILYQSCTGPNYRPDHMTWLDRKRNTVLKFGCSSLVLRERMRHTEDGTILGDSEAQEVFVAKYGVDGSKYVANGGAVPIRLEGSDEVVGVVCCSGVKQEQDHDLAVKGLVLLSHELGRA